MLLLNIWKSSITERPKIISIHHMLLLNIGEAREKELGSRYFNTSYVVIKQYTIKMEI